MKLFLLLLSVFFMVACMETPDAPSSKATIAKEKIQFNKTEAQQAQNDYLKLQKQRRVE